MTTLDICHKQYLSEIASLIQQVSEMQSEFEQLSTTIQEFDQKGKSSLSDSEFKLYIELIDKQIILKENIDRLNKRIDEDKYYTDISDILYQYYNLIENGQGQSDQIVNTSNKNSIMNYFMAKSKPKIETNESASNTVSECITNKKTRGNLLEAYMSTIDNTFLKSKSTNIEDKCIHCGSKDMVVLTYDGYMYCKECSTVDNLIVDHDKPSYKDPPKEVTYFSYKRINHLNEWLNQIQGKESTEIPEEIYDKILLEIKKQRITNMADLSYDKVKRILKHLKVHKYYEHIPHIINRLNGLPMPNFSYELEEKLRSMFKQIQAPFLRHSPANRKNFLSYSFVLHKSLQLLEKDEYLLYFPLLKSRDKLASQDKIWKLICEECGWQFIPSL